jgi:hypothetical protein
MKKAILSFLLLVLTLPFSTGSVFATGFENDPYVYLNNVDDPSTVEEIKTELTVFDLEDGNLTDQIYIVTDNYTGNETVLGDFVVVYGVTDSGGLESTVAIIVRNVDVLPPEFVVEEDTLLIKEGSNLALNMPKITAIDGFDGDLTSEIEITGLDLIDTNVLGIYNLIYSVSDSSGNNTTETFVVQVVDGIQPLIQGPQAIVKRFDYILPSDFYLDYFEATDDKDGLITNRIEVVEDNFSGKGNIPGEYTIKLQVSDNANNVTTHILTITVDNKMYPMMIIDSYDFIISYQDQFTDDIFIDTLKYIDDLPNASYIFDNKLDNYTDNHDIPGAYLKSFHLISDGGTEYDRSINITVIESDFNIILETPDVLDNIGTHVKHWWPAYAVGVIGLIGLYRKF